MLKDVITYGLPDGCLDEDGNGTLCDYYLILSPNIEDKGYYIHLEGVAKGWVAVGFSLDQKMASLASTNGT